MAKISATMPWILGAGHRLRVRGNGLGRDPEGSENKGKCNPSSATKDRAGGPGMRVDALADFGDMGRGLGAEVALNTDGRFSGCTTLRGRPRLAGSLRGRAHRIGAHGDPSAPIPGAPDDLGISAANSPSGGGPREAAATREGPRACWPIRARSAAIVRRRDD